MHALCPEAASVPFLQMRNLRVCGVEAAVFRISFTGEAGYLDTSETLLDTA